MTKFCKKGEKQAGKHFLQLFRSKTIEFFVVLAGKL
jgi:hypothetical protein